MGEAVGALAALGIASNAISVVDFAFKVGKTTYLAINSPSNTIEENRAIETLARDCERLDLRDEDLSERPVTGEIAHIDELVHANRNAGKELLELVQRFRLDGSKRGLKRYMDGAKKVTKSTMAKAEVASKQRLLSDLNGQLALALIQLMSKRQVAYFQELEKRMDDKGVESVSAVLSAKDVLLKMGEQTKQHATLTEAQRAQLLNKIADNLGALTAAVGSQDVVIKHFIQSAETEQEVKGLRKAAEKLRGILRYDEPRWEEIDASYRDTYTWILESPGVFRTWLEHENGIFWISGKAGAGKSTLMKFLAPHGQTRRFLAEWAGENSRLVTVKVAFWYSDRPVRNPFLVLIRSIMFQILEEVPELWPVTFPDRWKEKNVEKKTRPWTYEELLDALRVVQSLEGYKFCFFIDGLDEFQGGQGRHVELAHTLDQMSTSSNIKLCLSSRPWHVFESSFGKLHSTLRLEDLTRDDITAYVFGRLEHVLAHSEDTRSIAADIVAKAEGVFLWVALVVNELLEEAGETGDAAFMRERVADLPPDLDDYFRVRIFSRIKRRYRPYTGQALYLAYFGLNSNWISSLGLVKDNLASGFGQSVLPYWLLRHHLAQQDFATRLEIMHCDRQKLRAMAEETQTLLKAWTKDFLHIPQMRADALPMLGGVNNLRGLKVEFLHRTVYDFLKTRDMQALMHEHVPSHWFDDTFPFRVCLASAKIGGYAVDYWVQCGRMIQDFEPLASMPDCSESRELLAEYDRVAATYVQRFCDAKCLLHRPPHRPHVSLNQRLIGQNLHCFLQALEAKHPGSQHAHFARLLPLGLDGGVRPEQRADTAKPKSRDVPNLD